MRASFDEVSSRRLYNIASLGGTADQLKNEISYISLYQSSHLFPYLRYMYIITWYDYDGDISTAIRLLPFMTGR